MYCTHNTNSIQLGKKIRETTVLAELKTILAGDKIDAVICVAGGWAGGNAAAKDFVKSADIMWRQSVWSSVLAATI
ncbi:dihydropteridine reductase, partial [Diaphorina citri]